ncbi:MAG TPA: response regulator transcription factor [Candidatus Krumholzibacteria bacterium]|nr:response regulator transcription factor [Candidatus Krumholzibacteria bacterium]
MKILVVEDYEPLRHSLSRGLREDGHAVDDAADGAEGLAYAEASEYDVIILDVMLPRLDGFQFLKRLRDRRSAARVLVLTAKNTVNDRVRGLDLGADDYLVKPFAFEELKARVRALERRAYRRTSPVIKIGELEIDTTARTARMAGEDVDLTAREYTILEILALRSGEVVTREQISSRIYDFNTDRASNIVDVYVGYLRRKLERGGRARLIHTRRGFGYVLSEENG